MNVQTAIDIFSEAIESAVEHVDVEKRSFGKFRGLVHWTRFYNSVFVETRNFMSHCRAFWLVVNHGKVITNLYNAEATIFEPLRQFEDYLRSWEREASETGQPFLTKECYEDAMTICGRWPHFIRYLFGEGDIEAETIRFRPRKITQDFLERDFGLLRQSVGGLRNPPLKSLVYSLRRINQNRLSKAFSLIDN